MLKFTVQTKPLQEALNAVSLALPRNSPSEAWNHVSLRLESNSIAWIYATSGKITAVASVAISEETLDVNPDGTTPIGLMLNDSCIKTIGLCTQDTVGIQHKPKTHRKKRYLDNLGINFVEEDYDSVTIDTVTGKYNLDVKTLPFSPRQSVGFDDCLEFQPDHFMDMIALLSPIHDDIEYRMNLAGVHIQAIEPILARATATDGRRIGIGDFPCAVQGNPEQWGAQSSVMPRHLLRVVASAINQSDGLVRVTFTDRVCAISVGDTVYTSPLAEGRFPDVRSGCKLLETKGTKVGSVSRETLVYGLSLAAITLNRKLDYVGVTIRGGDGRLTFDSLAPEAGSCHVLLDDGVLKSFYITLDPTFVLPVLRHLKDETVVLTIIDDGHAMIDAQNFRYLLAGVDPKAA